MNKKYGIGFFLGFLVLVLLFVLAYRISYQRALDKHNQQNKQLTEAVTETELCYYIKELDGYVTVYESDNKTVYDYTTILVDVLPEEIREKVKKGIKMTSLGQVYGFLENYSS